MEDIEKLGVIVKNHDEYVIFNYNGYEKSLYLHDIWIMMPDVMKKYYVEQFILNVKLFVELDRYGKNINYDYHFYNFKVAIINNIKYILTIVNHEYYIYKYDEINSCSNTLCHSHSLRVIAEYSDENINMADYFDFDEDIKIALK